MKTRLLRFSEEQERNTNRNGQNHTGARVCWVQAVRQIPGPFGCARIGCGFGPEVWADFRRGKFCGEGVPDYEFLACKRIAVIEGDVEIEVILEAASLFRCFTDRTH